jgi:hypothetical protein
MNRKENKLEPKKTVFEKKTSSSAQVKLVLRKFALDFLESNCYNGAADEILLPHCQHRN